MSLTPEELEYVGSLELAIKRSSQDGLPVLWGSFERLVAIVQPTFEHVIAPANPQMLSQLRSRLSSAKHNLVCLFTIASRLKYLQNLLSTSTDPNMQDFVSASVETDIIAFHTFAISLMNDVAMAIFEVFGELPAPFDFNALTAQIRKGVSLPLGIASPLGEAVIAREQFFKDITNIVNLSNTMGATTYCLTKDTGEILFQIVDWHNVSIFGPERVTLGMPKQLIDAPWINAEVYLGACLGFMINFMNEVALQLFNLLAERKDIVPVATLNLKDASTFEVLRSRGISESDLTRIRSVGSGTVTISTVPVSQHFVIGTNHAIDCMTQALAFLKETPQV